MKPNKPQPDRRLKELELEVHLQKIREMSKKFTFDFPKNHPLKIRG